MRANIAVGIFVLGSLTTVLGQAAAPPPSVVASSAINHGQNLFFNYPGYPGWACNWCHGGPGAFTDVNSNPSKEVLMGVSPARLAALRANPPAPWMGTLLAAMSPSDMEDLSAYLAVNDPTQYSVSGRVTTSAGVRARGAGLAGVTVTIGRAPFANATTTTNANGDFSFTNLHAGTNTLTLVKAGYTFRELGSNPVELNVERGTDPTADPNVVVTTKGTVMSIAVNQVNFTAIPSTVKKGPPPRPAPKQ